VIRGVAPVYNSYEYRKEARATLLVWGQRLRAIVGAPVAPDSLDAPREGAG
jgi:hypothetical protein